jgi:hypothetical protein
MEINALFFEIIIPSAGVKFTSIDAANNCPSEIPMKGSLRVHAGPHGVKF